MPLTPEEQQEFAKLKRFKELQAKFEGEGAPAQEEPGFLRKALGKVHAFQKGRQQAMTMGHLPQIEGGISSLLSGTSYVKERDKAAAEQAAREQQHPIASTGGKVMGTLGAAAAMPIGGAARGLAGAAKHIGKQALAGGAIGAAQAPPTTPGQITPPAQEIQQRAQQAAMGGAIGGGAGAVGQGITQLAGPAGGMVSRAMAGMRKPEATEFAKNTGQVKKLADQLAQGKERQMQHKALVKGKKGLESLNKTIKSAANRLDNVLEDKTVKVPGRKKPARAKAVNRLKRQHDKAANYKKSRLYTEEEVAKKSASRAKADKLRNVISTQVPGAKTPNKIMRRAYKAKDYIKPKVHGDDPDALFKSDSIKDVGALQTAERLGAKGLVNYSRQRTAAQALTPKGGGVWGIMNALMRKLGQTGVLAGPKAQAATEIATEPGSRALIQAIQEMKR